jgi:hypothetical protein
MNELDKSKDRERGERHSQEIEDGKADKHKRFQVGERRSNRLSSKAQTKRAKLTAR